MFFPTREEAKKMMREKKMISIVVTKEKGVSDKKRFVMNTDTNKRTWTQIWKRQAFHPSSSGNSLIRMTLWIKSQVKFRHEEEGVKTQSFLFWWWSLVLLPLMNHYSLRSLVKDRVLFSFESSSSFSGFTSLRSTAKTKQLWILKQRED